MRDRSLYLKNVGTLCSGRVPATDITNIEPHKGLLLNIFAYKLLDGINLLDILVAKR